MKWHGKAWNNNSDDDDDDILVALCYDSDERFSMYLCFFAWLVGYRFLLFQISFK